MMIRTSAVQVCTAAGTPRNRELIHHNVIVVCRSHVHHISQRPTRPRVQQCHRCEPLSARILYCVPLALHLVYAAASESFELMVLETEDPAKRRVQGDDISAEQLVSVFGSPMHAASGDDANDMIRTHTDIHTYSKYDPHISWHEIASPPFGRESRKRRSNCLSSATSRGNEDEFQKQTQNRVRVSIQI